MFVKPMREKNCMTMLDPFHFKYGKVLTAGMSLISLFLDLIWVPGTLIGLGRLYRLGYIHLCNTLLRVSTGPAEYGLVPTQ